ncbi:type I-G CRISPR-associated protein Csb2 [Teichococcus aestuarii]|uniref:type I-G CRISPR-associated protein Csb2 n=1 Tax=Teichococcus aestuarii TaxID=568898 RepID=UPI0015E7F324|nr:type I-U CRISPR-associated protein Csb2 [Pseudoroseomonas aestuarii]
MQAVSSHDGASRSGGADVPLVIEARFVSDRIMAATKDDRSQAEWPLHWGRCFSAHVAALHEMPPGDPGFAAAEDAVCWLETLGPPEIHACEGHRMPSLQSFVPVNDGLADPRNFLPDSSSRNRSREFPGVTVRHPVLRYAWRVGRDDIARHRVALQRLLAGITYLGRSVNFAFLRLLEVDASELPEAGKLVHWIPDPRGDTPMRTAAPGRLAWLRELHARGQGTDRGPVAFYARRSELAARSAGVVAGPWKPVWAAFALPQASRFLSVETEPVAKAVRAELVRRLRDVSRTSEGEASFAVDPFFSGHAEDGAPWRGDRLAIVPLANVLHSHADGRLLGFAVLMPDSADAERWRMVSELIYGGGDFNLPLLESFLFDRNGHSIRVPLFQAGQGAPSGLGPGRYVATSRRWTTITPILLSRRPDSGRRNAGHADEDTVRELVARDCELSGLPRPALVEVSATSPMPGVARAASFRQSRGGNQRWSTHALLEFNTPVAGPLLVGAGRYNGLGLLTPVGDGPDPISAMEMSASEQ